MNNLLSPPSQSLAWTPRWGMEVLLVWRIFLTPGSAFKGNHVPDFPVWASLTRNYPGRGPRCWFHSWQQEECGGTSRAGGPLTPPPLLCTQCLFPMEVLWAVKHFLFRQHFLTDVFQMLCVDLCITTSLACVSQHEGRATFCQVSVGFVGARSCCHSKWDQDVTIPTWEGFS